MSDEDTLFRAFCAGFDTSGEGFNGEYVGRRYRETPRKLERELRWNFDHWQKTGQLPDDLPPDEPA